MGRGNQTRAGGQPGPCSLSSSRPLRPHTRPPGTAPVQKLSPEADSSQHSLGPKPRALTPVTSRSQGTSLGSHHHPTSQGLAGDRKGTPRDQRIQVSPGPQDGATVAACLPPSCPLPRAPDPRLTAAPPMCRHHLGRATAQDAAPTTPATHKEGKADPPRPAQAQLRAPRASPPGARASYLPWWGDAPRWQAGRTAAAW